MANSNTRNEALFKKLVFENYFKQKNVDWDPEIYKIDFTLTDKQSKKHYAWLEAKEGKADELDMITQLILTIKKPYAKGELLPPPYIGCFDSSKITFVPFHTILDIFNDSDVNWITPSSSHKTDDFIKLKKKIKKLIDKEKRYFAFETDGEEIKNFIKENILKGEFESQFLIDKNNFVFIYNKWLEKVKPTICMNWVKAKNSGIIDGDFYLADLLSEDNISLKKQLRVFLQKDCYKLSTDIVQYDEPLFAEIQFNDKQRAHNEFWKIYERPPLEEFWDYIVERRDLLVPQDIRERKGSFFTPKIWVELSQKYIADAFGEDWQDEYYVWDCAAGTGNLLAGLTNKYNIWASTIDKADVDVMMDRIHNGANLLEKHVFQFDFLNDSFDKLPKGLKNIIDDEEKRKKLIIYINPPYAEGDSKVGKGRKGIQKSKIRDKYQKDLGNASAEIFAQFLIRIAYEIDGCKIANFSKLKSLQSPNFENFRKSFSPKLEKLFIVPSTTFDNVPGAFPIGFFIWDTSKKEVFKKIKADVYNKDKKFILKKGIVNYNKKYISNWLEDNSRNISENYIGHLASVGNDFQNQNMIFLDDVNKRRKKGGRHTMISAENLIFVSIYYSVRKAIPADWLNDRDQFLYPNDEWQKDKYFQSDCITYTLFSNNIQSKYGTNHWIPFKEKEVNAKNNFESHFMTDFISEMLKSKFSKAAVAVFNAGRELWKYYHEQQKINVNASLYDIREYFQGRNEKGKMNNKSNDEKYNELIGNLRDKLKMLAKEIEPKIYEYGFLK